MDEDGKDISENFRKIIDEYALFEAIEQKNHKRFRSLITQPGFVIDQVDRNGRSLLMHLATIQNGYIFAQHLLDRGADVHLRDNFGYSFLHLAVRAKNANNVKMGELLIRRGADVDDVDRSGLTPMYLACLEGNVKWVHLLLYYGADPNIASIAGILPMGVLSSRLRGNDYEFLLEILFNYAFDQHSTLPLSTLAAAMWRESSLFSKICEISPPVTYDWEDIQYFCGYLFDVKSKHFQIFIEKFDYVLEDIIDSEDFLQVVNETIASMKFPENWNILNSLLESVHVSKLIHNTDPSVSYISHIIKTFAGCDIQNVLVSKIFLMLSYGLGVTLQDLQTVFNYYGDGYLFRTLLHMDVAPISKEVSGFVRLCYDPKFTLEDCWDDPQLEVLLNYYNSPRLKELCSSARHVEKVKQMPSVSSLIELSRNVVRQYIIQRYEITSCRQFYAVLNGLPIDRITKSIIALGHKVY